MAYLQVVAGLVLLVFAGDYLVRGAVSVAQRAGVSKLVIGLTIVAFGTSAPELVVGIDSVLKGAPTLALGNVVGSNIANILLVLGVPALIAPMACDAPRLGRNLMIMLIASALFVGLAHSGSFSVREGSILLAFLSLFLIYSGIRAKSAPSGMECIEGIDDFQETPDSYKLSIILVLGGLLGLAIGADLLVIGSVDIARNFGISEAVIGLTLVAIGTSIPELVTALVASLRGHCDVAVGNVIGSNLFNTLGIMGVTAFFGTVPVPESFLQVDLWVMMAASMLLVPYCHLRSKIGRISGLILILLYISYMRYIAHNVDNVAIMGMHL